MQQISHGSSNTITNSFVCVFIISLTLGTSHNGPNELTQILVLYRTEAGQEKE